jgi:hypothetical protein
VSVLCRTQVHVAFVVGILVIVQVGLLFLPKIHVASLFHLSDFQVYGAILAGNLPATKLFESHGRWVVLVIVVLWIAAYRAFRKLEL